MSLQMNKSSILLILLGFLAAGCNYQFGRGDLTQRYSTISVPYVEGDQRGDLTSEVIKKVGTSGSFRYVSCGGDLTLKIKLLDFREENINFRYDRKRTGRLKHQIIPTQTRSYAIAEIQLVEGATGKTILGPAEITASAEFDHTYYSTWHKVNIFSLGQLNDIDEARDAVMQPLNRHLAEKIVDYIVNAPL